MVNYLLWEEEKQLLGAGNHMSNVGGNLFNQTFIVPGIWTRVIKRHLVPSRSCQSGGEDRYLNRGPLWFSTLAAQWNNLGSFKKIVILGDSDFIVLGCGLGIRTFQSSLGNCNFVRV